jgi:hypothetical protein
MLTLILRLLCDFLAQIQKCPKNGQKMGKNVQNVQNVQKCPKNGDKVREKVREKVAESRRKNT